MVFARVELETVAVLQVIIGLEISGQITSKVFETAAQYGLVQYEPKTGPILSASICYEAFEEIETFQASNQIEKVRII